jgi:hypothetical protein
MNSVLQGADWLARWVSGKTAMPATSGWEFQDGGRGVVGQWKLRGPMSILGGVRVFHREFQQELAYLSCTALRWCRMRRQEGRKRLQEKAEAA